MSLLSALLAAIGSLLFKAGLVLVVLAGLFLSLAVLALLGVFTIVLVEAARRVVHLGGPS